MKKILKASLAIFVVIVFAIMSNTYALTGNITMQASEVSNEGEFTVEILLSNIQSDIGVVAFGGTLEYEKDALTLEKIEAQNTWGGLVYNEETGIFAVDSTPVKTDGAVVKMTFKVNADTSKTSTTIKVTDIMASDGTPLSVSSIEKTITIKSGTQDPGTSNPGSDTPSTENPSETPTGDTQTGGTQTGGSQGTTTGSGDNQGTSTQGDTTVPTTSTGTNTNGNTNTGTSGEDGSTVKSSTLPKTGENSNIWIVVAAVGCIAVALYFVVKMKLIRKK